MLSSEEVELLEKEQTDLVKEIIQSITKTVVANGVEEPDATKLANAIYENLDSKSYLGNAIEYGQESINTGYIVHCSKDSAEYIRTVSDWESYDE